MIVRQQKEIPTRYVFGFAGAVALAVGAIVTTRSMLVTVDTPNCSERYSQGVRFSWTRQSGEALTPADLQARLGGRDWGLIENVNVRKIADGPATAVLEVDLKTPHVAGSEARDGGRSGMGFVWLPKALPTATAGCLSYSIWVPPDFNFGAGGALPGLFGDEQTSPAAEGRDEKRSFPFSTRIRWRPDAGLAIVPSTQDSAGKAIELAPVPLRLERGRWVKIEQEIELNEPGVANGTLRVWINGVIGIERSDMRFRGDAAQSMTGVNVDVHFADDSMKWAPALKSTRLRLSPVELLIK